MKTPLNHNIIKCIGILLIIAKATFSFATTATLDSIPMSGNACLKCHAKLAGKAFTHKPVTSDCMKCHEALPGVKHPLEDTAGYKLIKPVPELCYTCHEQKNIMKEKVHSPVKDGDCLSCHDVHTSKGEHLLSAAPPGLCYSCHNDLQKSIETSTVKHGALTEKKSCVNCHSPHSSDEKKNLLAPQPDLCLNCHDKAIKVGDRTLVNMKQLITKSKYTHGALDMGGCMACHNPHASNNHLLLNKPFPEGNYAAADPKNYALCMDCHEEALFKQKETVDATGFRNGNTNLHYIHVNKDKGRVCINCHNVHASNKLFLIAERSRFGNWDMPINFVKAPKGGSCSPGCHAEKSYSR